MSIKVQNLVDQKARKYGASAEDVNFQQIMLDAINYVLDDIENKPAAASAPRVTGIGGTIALDAQQYQSLISLGVDFYLQDMSEYSIQSLAGVEQRYKEKLNTAQVTYYKSIDLGYKFGVAS